MLWIFFFNFQHKIYWRFTFNPGKPHKRKVSFKVKLKKIQKHIFLSFLKPGHNEGLFVVDSVHVEVPFSIFLLDQNAKLVLTDIDGTITESNIKGLVFPQFGIDAHQVSCGVFLKQNILFSFAKQYIIHHKTSLPAIRNRRTSSKLCRFFNQNILFSFAKRNILHQRTRQVSCGVLWNQRFSSH